jgi:hypothetical protein
MKEAEGTLFTQMKSRLAMVFLRELLFNFRDLNFSIKNFLMEM